MSPAQRLADARSFLFVPGNRPDRFAKAVRSGADAVILDLEDSVPAGDKAAARQAVMAHGAELSKLDVPLIVRVNSDSSAEWAEDLVAVGKLEGVAAVMVPKAESSETLDRLHTSLGLPLLPLIETAGGFYAVRALAATPGVLRLAVGHIDFMADTGMTCDAEESELAPLRFAVAMATRWGQLRRRSTASRSRRRTISGCETTLDARGASVSAPSCAFTLARWPWSMPRSHPPTRSWSGLGV